MLYSLIYYSHSVGTMYTKDMNPILVQSRARNSIQSLTGMLIYVEGVFNDHAEGRFLQILEGTKKEVTEVYASIKNDLRHNKVTIIKEGPIEERNFSSWKMGYKSYNLARYPDLQFFFDLDTKSLIYNDNDHPMLEFLKSFSLAGKNIR
jgi:hypothetical protein